MPQEQEQRGSGSGANVELEDGDPTGDQSQISGSETDGSDSSGQPTGDPAESQSQTSQFRHQLLRGKKPEEIERLFESLQDANRSMNEQLNRRVEQPAAPTPGAQPAVSDPLDEEPDYGDSFIAPHLKTMEERIARRLEKAVSPLQQSQRAQQAETAREKLSKELKHFKVLETSIDQLIRDQGGNPKAASEAQLRLIYYTAVGLANDRGINLNQSEAPTPQGEQGQPPARKEEQQPMGIPQHRPSGAPLPRQGTQNRRKLTEDERRLAREFFPDAKDPEGEYIKEQDADEGDVVQPGFSKKNW
jgi:hypothetical protein